jgi:hypothetical protein
VQGSFDIFCFSSAEYDALITLIEENTDDGLLTIMVYVGSDINDDVEVQAYCTTTLEYRKTIRDTVTKYKLHVEIEEQ